MRKILITMVAIAFSLSAFSETRTIYVLDEYKSSPQSTEALITIWCVKDSVFIETREGSLVQMMGNNPSMATPCWKYLERKNKK